MESISLRAYAKINLALDVIRKRSDGYHDVRMVMQTIQLYDKLIMKVTLSPSITINTNLSYLPSNENNLVYAAAKLFKDTFYINDGVFVQLDKRIPVSAGMAGGSADAAAALIGLNELFDTKLSISDLQKLAVKLGADVPYCLMRGTALAEGIGEILTPLQAAPFCYCLVVKPPVNVSTKYVYENLKLNDTAKHCEVDAMLKAIQNRSLKETADALYNLLETVTLTEYPEIGQIKNHMCSLGALGSLMSGSGPTVFGLFDNLKKAQKAFYEFKISKFGKQTFLTEFYHQEK